MDVRGTRLEVDLGALAHNYGYLKSLLAPGVLFMGVVKANAYGHGIVPIARELQELGADYLAVAYVEEGAELRRAGITLPILVLHVQTHNLERCIEHCLEPVIYRLDLLQAFSKAVNSYYLHSRPEDIGQSLPTVGKAGIDNHNKPEKQSTSPYPIHIEFNTGLNRIGIDPEEVSDLLTVLTKTGNVRVKGIQSHLAASEDHGEQEFTTQQLEQFTVLADQLENALGYQTLRHTTNTSGVLNYATAHHSMVRSGIGLYGYANDIKLNHNLKPVASLISQISQIRTIEKGESVSYNRKFTSAKRTRYAVIAIGHGDGIDRRHGNGVLEVIVRGKKAQTLGVICMDMFMVDVSHIPEAQVGDEVVIFDKSHPANGIAEKAGTISYELLTGIRTRVPRFYLR